jgi:hypothetical protein
MRKIYMVQHVILPLAALAFIGCAHMEHRDRASQEQLTQRVNAYWNARMKDQVEAAYQIEDPEVRKKVPIHQYVRTTFVVQQGSGQVSVKLLSFKVLAVDIHEDQAKVSIQHKFRIGSPVREQMDQSQVGMQQQTKRPPAIRQMEVTLSRDEEWVRSQGEWYHKFKDSQGLAEAIIQAHKKRMPQESPRETR